MSSIVKVADTFAPVTGLLPRAIVRLNAFGSAARFGLTANVTWYGPSVTVCVTGPGPTWALTEPTCASAREGGGKLVSIPAAKIAATTSGTSIRTVERSTRGARARRSGSLLAAARTSSGVV